VEFFYWPGDQWNPAEIAYGPNHNDRFYVKGLGSRFRQSPRDRKFLENPANGWIRLVPEDKGGQ
jgi:hypothetical protein